MLKIERLRVEIETENETLGIDEKFSEGLNFLASDDNTWGKSSVLEAIYYALGLEQIIGGKGEKVLTSVYKTYITNDHMEQFVLESKIFLQISNGEEHITLYRSAKQENRDSKLISVYFGTMESIEEGCEKEDMYVHMSNSAISQKGFHAFLQQFLHLDLPKVPTNDGSLRPLYLQLIFSCMFIEQKHGWGDIFSGMPILGIRDSKKRVIEYILALETLNNEKKKDQIKNKENHIRQRWRKCIDEIVNNVSREECKVMGLIVEPCIVTPMLLEAIKILNNADENLSEYIGSIQQEIDEIQRIKPKICDNYEELKDELNYTEDAIAECQEDLTIMRESLIREKASIRTLNNNLEIVENDLRNNKEAARLRDLGSELSCDTSRGVCPLCQTPLQDSLMPNAHIGHVMSVDENVRHLSAQKTMLQYGLKSHTKKCSDIGKAIDSNQGKIFYLHKLAKELRNDLYSIDDNISESLIYKKIQKETKIDRLLKLEVLLNDRKNELSLLGEEWKKVLNDRKTIPDKKFTVKDLEKVKLLRTLFVENLVAYSYNSGKRLVLQRIQ